MTKAPYLYSHVYDEGGQESHHDLKKSPQQIPDNASLVALCVAAALEHDDSHRDEAGSQGVDDHGLVILEVPISQEGEEEEAEDLAGLWTEIDSFMKIL